jgi:hypothetical protein
MSLTLNGNRTGAAAHGRDELADDFTRPTDEVLKFIKAHCEPEAFHMRFNEIYARWYNSDYKRYTSELRAWRQEIANVLAEREKRDKAEVIRVSTGMLDRTPTAAQLRAERQARAQALKDEMANIYGFTMQAEPKFGSAEWFNNIPEREF